MLYASLWFCLVAAEPDTRAVDGLVASALEAWGVPGAAVVVVQGDETEGVHLIHVRRRVASDALTARETEVAEAFSLGDTHRDIAQRLAISPSTVRRHLANIYEKLGISSKVELDRMLASSR